jgi:tRNA(Ile)-lysidine synthase
LLASQCSKTLTKHNQLANKLSNSLTNAVEQQVERAFPPEKWVSVRTLVAVSGGADSVALVRALAAISQRCSNTDTKLIVGHVNHRLRGVESDADESFVRELANELGIEFHGTVPVSDAVVPDSEKPGPSEESLRDSRYVQLIDLANQSGARYLVTGHNFDDQVETILFRILRGTGISGLAGIPQYRLAGESVTIVRPLLETRRKEILTYLQDIEQLFRDDRSNFESVYSRNYLRNRLIPELRERFGESVPESIARLGQQAKEVDEFLTDQAAELFNAVITRDENRVAIDCDGLRTLPPILVRQFISLVWSEQKWPRQSMTFQWWNSICAAIQSDDDVVLNLPCQIRFVKARSTARLSNGRASGESA